MDPAKRFSMVPFSIFIQSGKNFMLPLAQF